MKSTATITGRMYNSHKSFLFVWRQLLHMQTNPNALSVGLSHWEEETTREGAWDGGVYEHETYV